MAIVTNWITINKFQLGENFYGVLLIVPPLIVLYLRRLENQDKIFNITIMTTSFFMILGKLLCLVYHPDCWGRRINGNYLFDRHPLPLYDIVTQFILFITLVYLYKKGYTFVGFIWILFTTISGIIIQNFRFEYPHTYPINFPQLIYILILLIEIPYLYFMKSKKRYNLSN